MRNFYANKNFLPSFLSSFLPSLCYFTKQIVSFPKKNYCKILFDKFTHSNSINEILLISLFISTTALWTQEVYTGEIGYGGAPITISVSNLNSVLTNDSLNIPDYMYLDSTTVNHGYRNSYANEDLATGNYILNTSFAGLQDLGRVPDPIIAAGLDYIMLATNKKIGIFDKNGNSIIEIIPSEWYSDVNPTASIFDPKILYDQEENHWILVYLNGSPYGGSSSYLLSVSVTENPTGDWYLYKLDATLDGDVPTQLWADYTGLGMTSDDILISSTQNSHIGSGESIHYSKIRMLSKSQLYAGDDVIWYDFFGMEADNHIQLKIKPANHFTSPQTTGAYCLNTGAFGNGIDLWWIEGNVDINGINAPTINLQAIIDIGDLSSSYTVEQCPGNNQTNGVGSTDYAIQDVHYRNGYLYATLKEFYNWDGNSEVASLRYLKIDVTNNTTVINETFGAPDKHYYFPSIMTDIDENIVLVFNRSGPDECIGIYFTFRTPEDSYARPSMPLKEGEAHQGISRWGDYSGIALDPTDQNLFWFVGEYAADDADHKSTWVGSFKIVEGCSNPDNYNFDPLVTVDDGSCYGEKGDINLDGCIDILDFVILTEMILGNYQPNPYEEWAADYNGDGIINVDDQIDLISYILNNTFCENDSNRSNNNSYISLITNDQLNRGSGYVTEVLLYAETEILASHFELKLYDSDVVDVYMNDEFNNMRIDWTIREDTLAFLFYGENGETVPQGLHSVVIIESDSPLGRNSALSDPLYITGQYVSESLNINSIYYNEYGNSKNFTFPSNFEIYEPYPNPFNPQTEIKYFLYNDSFINISIFDLAGHLIEELVSNYQTQGYHSISWKSKNNSSGIYFVRITNGKTIITKKLLLLK